MIRVRIAPSPTGIPHIGNTRTALFNFLFARHNRGQFILRIEDTDRVRYVPESEKAICEILEWLGLLWDEKYVQSGRLDIYREYADKLLKNEMAYKDEGAVRFKMPKEDKTSWTDAVGNKEIAFDNSTQEDFVILKSDGFPTYNFANVVDDYLMKITHVIRGDEFISSTPKHIQLYKAFDWKPPVFAHLPVILGSDRQKLSKRHGAESVLYYREQGYLKEALLNFMVLLGWNPGEEREIMSIDEMVRLFDLKDVNTASPVFDIKKLEWFNGHYIRQLPIEELKSKINPSASLRARIKNLDTKILDELIILAQTRMTTLNDFSELTRWIFEESEVLLNEKEKQLAQKLIEAFLAIEQFSNETILQTLKTLIKTEGVKMSNFYKIITGKETGLPLPQALEILGREKTLGILKKRI
ncbi:MAG: glutamate--tRNA ligase [Candidatus Levybacteria bacterium]|nr:glutamate--tRNA ligase [Candidatus Levybacteria bacterium]